jgi:MOSC domain-containing protein YiiM
VIGCRLNVPVLGKAAEKAPDHFEWFTRFAAATRERLGRHPTQRWLIAGIDRPQCDGSFVSQTYGLLVDFHWSNRCRSVDRVLEGKNLQVVSLNVGIPRQIEWRDRVVTTGIFKDPVSDVRAVRRFNIDGDGQADLNVHGGKDKAIYAYPSEHYDYWRDAWPRDGYPWGIFGENLSTTGLFEDSVCIGDEFRVGTTRLVVTQPRMPCFKLGIRFGEPQIVERFLKSRRPGIYFGIVEEGRIAPGDSIELLSTDPLRLSVVEVLDLILDSSPSESWLRRALSVPALADDWRSEFTRQLAEMQGLASP